MKKMVRKDEAEKKKYEENVNIIGCSLKNKEKKRNKIWGGNWYDVKRKKERKKERKNIHKKMKKIRVIKKKPQKEWNIVGEKKIANVDTKQIMNEK